MYGKCVSEKIDWQDLRPTQWRKYAALEGEKVPKKREELKKWSINKVSEIFGVNVTDDESDAILIGLAYCNIFE